jgi:hypothetical protein
MDTANMLWVMLRSNTSQFGQNEITISREEFVKCVDYGLTLVVNMERERCADIARDWTTNNGFNGMGDKKRFSFSDVERAVRTATILCADDIMEGTVNG